MSKLYSNIGAPAGHRFATYGNAGSGDRVIRCECGARFRSRIDLANHIELEKLLKGGHK